MRLDREESRKLLLGELVRGREFHDLLVSRVLRVYAEVFRQVGRKLGQVVGHRGNPRALASAPF